MTATRRAGAVTAYSATIPSAPVTIPSSSVVGDIAIISIYTDGKSYKPATPSGWTKLGEFDGSFAMNLFVFWKVIAAGDPGTTVNVSPYGASGNVQGTVTSIEVWAGSGTPTIAFARVNSGVTPTLATPTGSIPLFLLALYDDSPNAPSTLATPSGLSGTYKQGSSPANGLGMYWGAATTGTSIPGQTFAGANGGYGLLSAIALPPSAVVNNAYIAGSTSAGDVLCSVVLAGSTAAADTTLLWTP